MMATGEVRTRDIEVRLSCGLCMEPYKDRTPKLLPCFHTFCLPCLETVAALAMTKHSALPAGGDSEVEQSGEKAGDDSQEKREENTDANSEANNTKCDIDKADDRRRTFECPTCRASIAVPDGGVSRLQTNFYLDVDNPSDSIPPAMCDTCVEGSRDKATHECGDCRNKMCSRCSRLHGMFAQGHRVQSVNARAHGNSILRVVKPTECPNHAGQSISFRCLRCDVNICLHCKLTSHEGHATEDTMVTVARAKGELSRLIVTANQQIHTLESVLGRLHRDSLELSRQKQEMMLSMSSKYEALVSWATHARDEALEEMDCVESAALKEIEAERVLAQGIKQILCRLVARGIDLYQTDVEAEIVLHKSKLAAALLSEDILTRYRNQGNREGHVTFFTCRSDNKAVQIDQVRDFVGRQERQEQNEKDKMEVMSLRSLSEMSRSLDKTLRELSEKILGLDNTVRELSTRSEVSDNTVRKLSKRSVALDNIVRELLTKSEVSNNTVRELSERSVALDNSLRELLTRSDVSDNTARELSEKSLALDTTVRELSTRSDVSDNTVRKLSERSVALDNIVRELLTKSEVSNNTVRELSERSVALDTNARQLSTRSDVSDNTVRKLSERFDALGKEVRNLSTKCDQLCSSATIRSHNTGTAPVSVPTAFCNARRQAVKITALSEPPPGI